MRDNYPGDLSHVATHIYSSCSSFLLCKNKSWQGRCPPFPRAEVNLKVLPTGRSLTLLRFFPNWIIQNIFSEMMPCKISINPKQLRKCKNILHMNPIVHEWRHMFLSSQTDSVSHGRQMAKSQVGVWKSFKVALCPFSTWLDVCRHVSYLYWGTFTALKSSHPLLITAL